MNIRILESKELVSLVYILHVGIVYHGTFSILHNSYSNIPIEWIKKILKYIMVNDISKVKWLIGFMAGSFDYFVFLVNFVLPYKDLFLIDSLFLIDDLFLIDSHSLSLI